MHKDQEFQQKAYLSKTVTSWCTVTQKGEYKRWKQGNKTGKKNNNKVFVDEQAMWIWMNSKQEESCFMWESSWNACSFALGWITHQLSLWIKINRQTHMGVVVVSIFYRLPDQKDDDEVFFQKLEEALWSQALVLMKDFNHSDTC